MCRQLPNRPLKPLLHDGHKLGQHLIPVHQQVLRHAVKLWENQRALGLLHGVGEAGFEMRLQQCGDGVEGRACHCQVLGGDGAQAA
jgi:hypothetical protein